MQVTLDTEQPKESLIKVYDSSLTRINLSDYIKVDAKRTVKVMKCNICDSLKEMDKIVILRRCHESYCREVL